MSLDNTILLAYGFAEALLLGLLVYKRAWRILPFFFAYCVWDLLSNGFGFITRQVFPLQYASYVTSYLIQTGVDSVLQFCILVELAWSVLRPIRSSLPRYTLYLLVFVLLLAGALIWPLTSAPGLSGRIAELQLIVRLQQTVSVLRILFFLALAGGSQFLSIGWRNRELQVATGFGVYSVVTLGTALLQTHQMRAEQIKDLNEFVIASFVCVLVYWIFSFAQKEAERRKFTPQMQNLLLAVAGAARANRAALAERSVADIHFRQKD